MTHIVRAGFACALAAVALFAPPALSTEPAAPTTLGVSGAAAQPRLTRIAFYPPRVVVLLPLESEVFGRAAETVKAGFLAAAQSAGEADVVAFLPYSEGRLEYALEAARFADPEWIVGPLTRNDVNALTRWREWLPPVLALNQVDDPRSLPAQVLTFGMAVEREARQAATEMRIEGAHAAAIVEGNGPLQSRLAAAFEQEWARLGGTTVGRLAFGEGAAIGKHLRDEIQRLQADAVFLALDAPEAQGLRPALGEMRLFATSLVYEGQEPRLLRDLEGVRFYGMPWVVQPGAALVAAYPRPALGSASLDRLYAFGIDAYWLSNALRRSRDPSLVVIDGVTGRIAMAEPQQFARSGVLTEIRGGELVPIGNP